MDNKLLAKYIFSETSPEEKELVEKWLSESNRNQAELLRLQKQLELVSQRYRPCTFQSETAFRKISSNLKLYPAISRSNFYRYSVAAIILIILGSGLLYFFVHPSETILTAHCKTGEILELYLPDSSLVTLNGPATITYPSVFKNTTREVSMQGKIYFQVHRDTNQPFIIHTPSIGITVLGTSFQVKANYQKAEVLVHTGKVEVISPDNNSQKILTAGMSTRWSVSSNQLSTPEKFDSNQLSWKTRLFCFNNMPLSEVIKILNEHFKTNIILTEKENDICLTATFESLSLSEILEIINQTLDIHLTLPGQ